MTELFIKTYSDEPTLINGDFSDGTENWTVVNGTWGSEHNLLVRTGSTAAALSQSCLLKTGLYKLELTVGMCDTYVTPDPLGAFYINLGDKYTGWIIGTGKFTYYYDVADITNQLVIQTNHVFEYGITNVKVTLLDGTWETIDLYSEMEVPLNYTIIDIEDITKRKGSYSNTITVPGTKHNNVLFKHLYNISTAGSFEMNRRYECYVMDEAIKIFEGYLEVSDVVVNQDNNFKYDLFITSNIIDLWTRVGDKFLRGNESSVDDLNFTEYNHVLNWTNISNSFTATPGSGYTYVMIDKTNRYARTVNYTDGGSWHIDDFSPALFVKEIWDKIFQKAGYTYTSTFLNSTFFKRLIYPGVDPVIRDATTSKYFHGSNSNVTGTNVVTINPTIDWPGYIHGATNPLWAYSNNSVNQQAFATHTETCFVQNNPGSVEATQAGYYNIDISMVYDRNVDVLYWNSGLGVWEHPADASPISTGQHSIKTYFWSYIERASGATYNPATDYIGATDNIFELPAEIDTYGGYIYQSPPTATHRCSGRFYMNVGDKIVTKMTQYLFFGWSDGSSSFWPWRYDSNPGGGTSWHDLMVNLVAEARTVETTMTVDSDNIITEDCVMKPTMLLHADVSQADFLKSIITMFNLYIEQTSTTEYKIEPRDDFYNSYTSVIDLTQKVDFDSYRLERPEVLLNKNIKFKTQEDDDTFTTTYRDACYKPYGDYIKMVPGATGTVEFETIFAPAAIGPMTEERYSDGSHRADIPKIFKMNSDLSIDLDALFRPRIMYWGGYVNTPNATEMYQIRHCDETQVTTITGKYPYAGHFDIPNAGDTLDINFGVCDWYWVEYTGTDWANSNNLVNKYYSNLLEELEDVDARVVTYTAILSAKDVFDIKFYNRILIRNVMYHLVSIDDYVPNKQCTLKLLKVMYIGTKPTTILPRPIVERPIVNIAGLINSAVINGTEIIDGGHGNVIIGDTTDNNFISDVIDSGQIDIAATGIDLDRIIMNPTNIVNTSAVDVIDPMSTKPPMSAKEIIDGAKVTNNEKLFR